MKLKTGLLAFTALLFGNPASAEPAPPLYMQAGAPVQARVDDLIRRMTLEEKLAQLEGQTTMPLSNNAGGLIRGGEIDEAVAQRTLSKGIGTFNLFVLKASPPAQGAVERNLIQAWVLKNTRLAIPILFHGEALHGALIDGATSFPQAIALGSTWDRTLIREVFDVVGRESRAAGNALVLAPVFDLARDPRYGRVQEMYSEDPYLVGELGLAAVRGLQGDGPTVGQKHVIATAKHFVHGQPEGGQNTAPNDVSERTMRSIFMAPFEKAVRIGHVGAVMPSYNENEGGLPSSANPWLLREVLRKEWGFSGLTVSDYEAVSRLHTTARVAATLPDAGVRALNAGVDMELPVSAAFPSLAEAVSRGDVAPGEVDAAVARVLTAKFQAGLFEHPYVDPQRATEVVGSAAHAKLARRVADQAIVLLKNDGALLPLNPHKIRTLAVIGPNADKLRLGTYSAAPAQSTTVLAGVRSRLGADVRVTYAEGVRISEPDANFRMNSYMPFKAPAEQDQAGLIAQAVETARSADAVVLVLGDNEAVAREAFDAFTPGGKPSLGDSDSLQLPGRQDELVREVAKLGKPIVAVVLNGRPYSLDTLAQVAPAILEGWYLGQAGGDAVADVLFGDVNPSGRLPVTLARNVGQLPVYYNHSPQARLGYVFDSNQPLFPFGYGLSYTTFAYGKPVLDRARIEVGGRTRVSIDVTNSGSRAGDEVVQMYVHPQYSSVVQPVLRLAGFDRIRLEPGKTKTVAFDLGPDQLAIWNAEMKRLVEPGPVDVLVGADVSRLQKVELDVAGPAN